MRFPVFSFLASVLYLTGQFAIANPNLSEEEIAEITEICCTHGQTFAVTASAVKQCNDAEPPDDIEREQTVLCLAGLRSCCEQHFKLKDECTAGLAFASAKRCSVPNTDVGKTCCEECSIGSWTGESQGKEACGRPAGEYDSPTSALRKNAYYQCCVEAAEKPTTTEPPSTTPKKPETTTQARERCKANSCEHDCDDESGKVRCSCREGYRLQADRKSCKDINECAEAVDDLCTAEDTVCHNVPGSFKCVPVRKREASKLTCPPGFQRNVQNQVCDDINECQSPRPPCPKYLCENTIGGYKCAGKPGKPYQESAPGVVTEPPAEAPVVKNENICPSGFRSGPDDECLDIDECEEHSDDCQRLSQHCINTHGGFFCQDHVSKRCPPGFRVNKATGICEDIDECEESSEVCKRTETCINMPGAYTCKSKISTLPKLGSSKTTCQEGTRLRPGSSICEDIDECREGSHLCDQFQNCINTYGGHECQCKNGFEMDPSGSCVDVDECALKLDNCREGTFCLNTVGTYTCTHAPLTSSTTLPPYEYEYYDSDEDNSTVDNETSNPAPKPTLPSVQPALTQPSPITSRTVSTTPVTTTKPNRTLYATRTTSTKRPYTSRPRPNPRPVPSIPTTETILGPITPNPRANPPPSQPRPEDGPRPGDEYMPERARPRPVNNSPSRPAYNRPIQRRPDENRPSRPTRPTEVNIPPPNNPITIEKEKDLEGKYDINTSNIPKDRWTNVIGKDNDEKPRPDDFDPNEVHCLNGYQKNAQGDCVDINECESTQYLCSSAEVCVNRPGGYVCECKPGLRRNATGWCEGDVTTSTSTASAIPPPPPLPPKPSDDTPYRPRPRPAPTSPGVPSTLPRPVPNTPPLPHDCELGYTFDSARGQCVDIDECATNKANCSPDEDCVNTEGGYHCVCGRRCNSGLTPSYDRREECGTPKAACSPEDCLHRKRKDRNPQCGCPCVRMCVSGLAPECVLPPRVPTQDSKVFTIGTDYGQRGPKYLRPTIVRSPTMGAYCPWGYKLTPDKMCTDIDECAQNVSRCGPQQKCDNFYGGHSCQCPQGHKLVGATDCEDIDECRYGTQCPYNSACVNTEGSYRCECGEGFRNAPQNDKMCVDVDECAENPDLCEHGCTNGWGGYRCYCKKGYRLNNDNRTCVDVDECAEWGAVRLRGRLCGGECVNEPGSYRCSCPTGYRLSEDGRSCIDIDECETGIAPCAHERGGEVCQNTRGGYHCHKIECPAGYRLESKHRCARITRQCPMWDWGCLHQPSAYSYNFITFVSHIYLPDGRVDLFTMHGPAWSESVVTFEMRMVDVQASPGVQPMDLGCFDMRTSGNIAVVSLLCSPAGPQVAELELSMSLHRRSQFAGSAVARLVVIVSQYEF